MNWLPRRLARLALQALLAAAVLGAPARAADAEPIVIGFDSEVGHADSTSDDAIRLGIEAALAEINARGGLLGRKVALRELDNRSLPARGVENLMEFIRDENTIAVFGGKYSPVVLQMLPHAVAHGMPLLVPWSAADAITRHGLSPNVAFRVGLTDSMAMRALLRAAREAGLRRGAFMAPRNAWGRSCLDSLQALMEGEFADIQLSLKLWHNRGDRDFAEQLQAVQKSDAQFIIGALNEVEGAGIVRAMARLPAAERLPVFSHWGITGGNFPGMAGPALREVQLAVVQTIIPSASVNPKLRRLLNEAAARMNLSSGLHFTSALGFVHAYDLTHLLAQAVRRAGRAERKAVLLALKGPLEHDGLLKRYRGPFANPRNEALAFSELRMAMFNAEGVLVPWRAPVRAQKRAGSLP